MSVFLLALAGTLVLAASQCGNPGFCVPEEAYTLLCPAASTDGVVSPANDGICYNPGATAFLLARPLRRPPPNATVYLYLFSNSIRKISAVDASFEFDAALDVAWRDDRFNVSAIAAVALTFFGDDSGAYAWASQAGGFTPSLEFGNSVSLASAPLSSTNHFMMAGPPDWTGVSGDGGTWITGSIRISGTFLQPQTLKEFPFDSQSASISIQSSSWPADLVTYAIPPGAIDAFIPQGDIDGWSKKGASVKIDKVSGRTDVSRATFTVALERIPGFYINRFVQPLCLMMTMAITSVGFANSPDRIGVPLAAFGATVSFLFVAANSVPVLPYTTRLDRFFLLCFYVCWILFLFNVLRFVFGERIGKFKEEAAKRRAASRIVREELDNGGPEEPTSSNCVIPAVLSADPPKTITPIASKTASTLGLILESSDRYDILFVVFLEAAFAVCAAVILAGPRLE